MNSIASKKVAKERRTTSARWRVWWSDAGVLFFHSHKIWGDRCKANVLLTEKEERAEGLVIVKGLYGAKKVMSEDVRAFSHRHRLRMSKA